MTPTKYGNLNVISGYLENARLLESTPDSSAYSLSLDSLFDTPNHGANPGSLEGIFHDKAKTQKTTVKALLDELKIRQNLSKSLLDRIDEEICEQHTEIMGVEHRQRGYVTDGLEDLEKLKLKVEDRVLELQREKRKEYVECWRDMMLMKNYLLSSLKEYWEIARKRDALSLDLGALGHDEIETGNPRVDQPAQAGYRQAGGYTMESLSG